MQPAIESSQASAVMRAGKSSLKRKAGMVLRRVIIYGIVFYGLWCAALFIFQDRIIYSSDMAPDPMRHSDRYGKTTIETKLDIEGGGQVVSWFVPAPNADANHPAAVAVFFHGNAEIIDFEDEIVGPYRALGVSVLLPEYRGYGRSGGKPSQQAIIDDCIKLYDKMLERPDVDKSRIIFHGRSLGSGVAVQVAAKRKPAVIILQSSFTSMASMANQYAVPSFVVRDAYRTDQILPTLKIPTLLAHGTRDGIIPIAHAQRLKALAPQALLITYDCDHNGFPGDENCDDYWNKIAAFLRSAKILSK
jgi:fermentation-respiration switch protein FrsA (DUF1100 family)